MALYTQILLKRSLYFYHSGNSVFLFTKRLQSSVIGSGTANEMAQNLTVKPMVGVAQMNCAADIETNFLQGKGLIEKAIKKGAQMVFLPECFDFVCESKVATVEKCQTVQGDIVTRYRNLAQQIGVWLSLGGFHERTENTETTGKIRNTHLLIDNVGEIKSSYSKTHLFDLDIEGKIRLKETDHTEKGQAVVPPVSTPVGNVGLAICYDLRFPELSITLTQQGAEILTYPSAFTVPTGMAHWEVLLRSRAIENQCYVIAAAQVGKHNAKRSSYGHAMIVDPWGCVIAECQDRVDVAVTEIDLDYLKTRRLEMPVWSHRRHDLYGHIQVSSKGAVDSQDSYQFGAHTISASCVFYRSALSFACVNIKPVLPGHVLVSPLRPAKRFSDLTQAEVADLYSSAQEVSNVIQREYGATSLTLSVQDGPEAGQTVQHVHVHILPRKKGDFKRNDEIYDRLEDHDNDINEKTVSSLPELRTEEDMAQEAAKLRKHFK